MSFSKSFFALEPMTMSELCENEKQLKELASWYEFPQIAEVSRCEISGESYHIVAPDYLMEGILKFRGYSDYSTIQHFNNVF